MAKEEDQPSLRVQSFCSRRPCPLSLVSLIACSLILVRVEFLHQRVSCVTNQVAELQNNHAPKERHETWPKGSNEVDAGDTKSKSLRLQGKECDVELECVITES